MAIRPGLLRVLRLLAWAAMVAGVYVLNSRTPDLRLGILYVIPVLLAAWHDGMHWGIAFALATTLLRFSVGIDQMPATSLLDYRVLDELAYLTVVGVAIAGLSQLRQTHSQLEQLATQDPLTNVLNARAFSHELAQELSRNRRYGRPLALIYLDLDDFKSVNDAHGHATGDAVLRLVADAMRGAVRQADVVGWLGGDEFGVLMPETDGDVAHAAANRLVSGIRTVFRGTPSVTASIGVVAVSGTDDGSGSTRSAPSDGQAGRVDLRHHADVLRSGRQPHLPAVRHHDRGLQSRGRRADRPQRAGYGAGAPQPAAGDGSREGRGDREGRRRHHAARRPDARRPGGHLDGHGAGGGVEERGDDHRGLRGDRAHRVPDLRHARRRAAGGAEARSDGHANPDAAHGAGAVRHRRAVHSRWDQDGGTIGSTAETLPGPIRAGLLGRGGELPRVARRCRGAPQAPRLSRAGGRVPCGGRDRPGDPSRAALAARPTWSSPAWRLSS